MDLSTFLYNEVKPAVGCTEPVAVALAAAYAAREFDGEIAEINLETSLNVYKNGRDVGIPGTGGLRGNRIAAALGALAGDAGKGLLVLEGVLSGDIVSKASSLVDQGKVWVAVREEVPSIYVQVTLRNAVCEVRSCIQGRHDLLHQIIKNGETVFEQPVCSAQEAGALSDCLAELKSCNIQTLWDLAGSIDDEMAAYMLEGADMNMAVAHQGLAGVWGLGVGMTLEEHLDHQNLLSTVKKFAGAAADVRMSGKSVPVMSSAGSGNHGITAVVPVVVVAERTGVSHRKLAEALAFSHLVTGYVKTYTGRLTPICGCSVAAGAGAAAGLVRIMGGDADTAEHAVASLIASLMGMLCDGAKGSCGLKVSAAAGEAYTAALMALDKRGVQRNEGLVSPDLHLTCMALSDLCTRAFANVDKVIVDILQLRPES